MSNDDTIRQLPTEDKLDSLIVLVQQIASDVKTLKDRVDSLEQKIDARLHDTRPIWEAAQTQITEFRNEVATSFRKFDRKWML